MSKTDIAKNVIALTTGYAVSSVITSIIRNNVSIDSKADELLVRVAGYVITGMIADVARKHTDRQVDSVISFWKKTTSTPVAN